MQEWGGAVRQERGNAARLCDMKRCGPSSTPLTVLSLVAVSSHDEAQYDIGEQPIFFVLSICVSSGFEYDGRVTCWWAELPLARINR
jgi:hypothetical protein